MQHVFSLKKPYLGLLVSITLLFSLFFLTKSPIFNFNSSALVSALTLDFTITIPVIYFLLIRKSNIPKTTVVPVFIIGLVIASYSIPQENQLLLNTIKTWLLPIVELSVLAYVIIMVRKLIKNFKKDKEQSIDFYDALKITTAKLLPKLPAKLLAMEISVFYYCFYKWKKTKLKPNEFTYHKNSGSPGLFIGLLLIIMVEMTSVHYMISQNNPNLAFSLLILSLYSAFQILGFLKPLFFRPIQITPNKLHLRYGVLAESIIDLNTIKSIEMHSKDIDPKEKTIALSPLGSLESHNVLIHLKKEQKLFGPYGIKKQFQSIVLYLDEKEKFIKTIETVLAKH